MPGHDPRTRPGRYVGRHRRPRPAWRRRTRYAALGLLTLAGPASTPRQHHGTRVVVAAAEPVAPQRIRPLSAAPMRLVTREVPARVLRGRATWYGPRFHGHRTASGETFDAHALTAAHRWLPFGTRLRVCRGTRCVVVRVNDRGPFGHAILDLSQGAAERLGMIGAGVDEVTATVLTAV